MAGQLSTPTWVSVPDEKMATVDVYRQTSSVPVNNIQDVLEKPQTSAAFAALRGGSSAMNALQGNLKGLTNGAALNVTDAMKRFGGPGALGRVNAVSPSLQRLATNELNALSSMAGKLPGMVTSATCGFTLPTLPKNLIDLSGLSNALSGWTGKEFFSQFKDLSATAAMAAAMAKQGLMSGMSCVLTTLKPILSEPVLMNTVIKSVLPDVNRYGNIPGLREMTLLAPSKLTSLSPSVTRDFSRAYPRPENPITTVQYRQNFTEMKTALKGADDGWVTMARQYDADGIEIPPDDEIVFDTNKIAEASPEFRKTTVIGALASEDTDDKMFLVANEFSEKPVKPFDPNDAFFSSMVDIAKDRTAEPNGRWEPTESTSSSGRNIETEVLSNLSSVEKKAAALYPAAYSPPAEVSRPSVSSEQVITRLQAEIRANEQASNGAIMFRANPLLDLQVQYMTSDPVLSRSYRDQYNAMLDRINAEFRPARVRLETQLLAEMKKSNSGASLYTSH